MTFEWLDEAAGPVVRPFALTRGRTRSSADDLDLIAQVTTIRAEPNDETTLGPEQERILRLARTTTTVADLAASLTLPVGVVRVLLGDLRDHGLIRVAPPASAAPRPSERILKEVINGLRAL
ncbi:DUF742 domain-containing protein [Sinosporangium siamense]|uniref:DUF742 domain-containing protein n=1 Tax=Sinosporangium siamense TaxID=1367973 RepID=A0A919V740_9ACTN|nr:DUF742 domain-containing protein [Sinosporangium siamense]GII94710.1 hypothetical protein Ssi02_49410 [Sinosporangium siamense]